MTVKSSLDLKKIIKPCKNRICKACGLYLNQLPVVEKVQNAQIFWVGLSAVQFEKGETPLPLAPFTRSGSLISTIENPLKNELNFYKTNLVKCVPINEKQGKIRYPFEHEMEKCFPNFEYEVGVLSPKIIFLLGKQVANFVSKKAGIKQAELPDDFTYNAIEKNGTFYIPVHHPSFILVYKRKHIESYIHNIQKLCKDYGVEKIPSIPV